MTAIPEHYEGTRLYEIPIDYLYSAITFPVFPKPIDLFEGIEPNSYTSLFDTADYYLQHITWLCHERQSSFATVSLWVDWITATPKSRLLGRAKFSHCDAAPEVYAEPQWWVCISLFNENHDHWYEIPIESKEFYFNG